MGEIAGVNTASLGEYLRSSKTRAEWAEGFHDELNGHVFDLEKDGFCQAVPWPSTHHMMITSNHAIPDRSPQSQQGPRLPSHTRTEV